MPCITSPRSGESIKQQLILHTKVLYSGRRFHSVNLVCNQYRKQLERLMSHEKITEVQCTLFVVVRFSAGGIFLTWIKFNPSLDMYIHAQLSVGLHYLSIPKLQRCTVEVWDWLCNFIPHFMMVVIAYPCWTGSIPNYNSNTTKLEPPA